MPIIPEKWRSLLSSNEIRALVLGSLAIQIGLIFLAPLRKRSTNSLLTLTLWVFYLAADSVATLAIGNVLSNQREAHAGSGHAGAGIKIPGELTALWAPFLLLHLAGPDTITSYSIEDNELWWRHLLGLVVQVSTAAFTFFQSPPNEGLWIPTILMFVPGVIKFIERILALRSGSKDNLSDNIISNLDSQHQQGTKESKTIKFIKRILALRSGSKDNLGDNIISNLDSQHQQGTKVHADHVDSSSSSEIPKSERELMIILEGYEWFDIFKRLLVDVTFTSKLLLRSQDRFSGASTEEALKLVSIELSFLYDILHTKAAHIHCTIGRVLRGSCLISIIAALVIFHNLGKQKYSAGDIIITYILFGAGLGLEVIAVVLIVLSDWMVVVLGNCRCGKRPASAITRMLKSCFSDGKPRWSNTIGQYNLVGLCLRDGDTAAWIMRKINLLNCKWGKKLKGKWDSMREVKSVTIPKSLEDMMFKEAKRRAQNVHIYNVLVEARTYRGSRTLERHGQLKDLGWSIRREFDECVILWHVATDICYHQDQLSNGSNQNYESNREVSWKVSNYMLYMLIQQPSMLQLGYGKTRFQATCDAAKEKLKAQGGKPGEKQARKLLLDEGGNYKEAGEHVLANGCRLARELQTLHDQKMKWPLISETWMEMLGYAAIHCESYQHAKALSRGGELLTHLWLLMAQLGVVEEHKMQQFQSAPV